MRLCMFLLCECRMWALAAGVVWVCWHHRRHLWMHSVTQWRCTLPTERPTVHILYSRWCRMFEVITSGYKPTAFWPVKRPHPFEPSRQRRVIFHQRRQRRWRRNVTFLPAHRVRAPREDTGWRPMREWPSCRLHHTHTQRTVNTCLTYIVNNSAQYRWSLARVIAAHMIHSSAMKRQMTTKYRREPLTWKTAEKHTQHTHTHTQTKRRKVAKKKKNISNKVIICACDAYLRVRVWSHC